MGRKIVFASFLIVFTSFFTLAWADVKEYNFEVAAMPFNPDGSTSKMAFGINGQIPGPSIIVNLGDQIVVHVTNNLPDNKPLAMHWHGMLQKGTQSQDGPSGATQCPLINGATQTYNFTADRAGSFWYHAHYHTLYSEGIYGTLIIMDPSEPADYGYSSEFKFTLHDWFHATNEVNEAQYFNTGLPPFPDSILINGKGSCPCPLLGCSSAQRTSVYSVKPGKVYRLRFISMAAVAFHTITIEGHTLIPIEVDGASLVPQTENSVSCFDLAPGQRYSFLLYTNPSQITKKRFTITAKTNLIPVPLLQLLPRMARAFLEYDNSKQETLYDETNTCATIPLLGLNCPVDEFSLVPKENPVAPSVVNKKFVLSISEVNFPPRASFNQTFYSLADNAAPSLALFLKGIPLPATSNPLIINAGDVVEICLNGFIAIDHPIHLHGYTFWVVDRGTAFDNQTCADYTTPQHLATVRRDVTIAPALTRTVIRFVADNPGVWLFHCHIEWHLRGGMAMTFVDSPELYTDGNNQLPDEMVRVCSLAGVDLNSI